MKTFFIKSNENEITFVTEQIAYIILEYKAIFIRFKNKDTGVDIGFESVEKAKEIYSQVTKIINEFHNSP